MWITRKEYVNLALSNEKLKTLQNVILKLYDCLKKERLEHDLLSNKLKEQQEYFDNIVIKSGKDLNKEKTKLLKFSLISNNINIPPKTIMAERIKTHEGHFEFYIKNDIVAAAPTSSCIVISEKK
jgi:hypothetical protein